MTDKQKEECWKKKKQKRLMKEKIDETEEHLQTF